MEDSPIGSDLQEFLDDVWIEARRSGADSVGETAFAENRARLGSQVHSARRARGLTQAQLARKLGVDQAEISRIEAGQSNPTLKTMSFLATVLGCALSLESSSSSPSPLVAPTTPMSSPNVSSPSRRIPKGRKTTRPIAELTKSVRDS